MLNMCGVKNVQYVWSQKCSKMLNMCGALCGGYLGSSITSPVGSSWMWRNWSHRAKRTLIINVIRGFSLKHISFVKWPKNLDGGQGLPIPVPGIDGHHLENDHLAQCSSNNHSRSFHVFTSGSFAVVIDKIHCSQLYSSLPVMAWSKTSPIWNGHVSDNEISRKPVSMRFKDISHVNQFYH